jgi:hypothetical protein
MPPKQKISKEAILQAAFDLVREQGHNSLNARSVANLLNCSVQPIFSCYTNMADLRTDVFSKVENFHADYFNGVKIDDDLFFNIGMAYIDFALEEPNLFRMLFMSNGFSGKSLNAFVKDDCNEHLSAGIPVAFDRDSEETNKMFTDMWLYAHGIASMLVSNQSSMERSEIETMVRSMFTLLTNKKGVML